ncbi:glucose PTS transporter subunit EIIB [Paenibacillus pini]|uniref:PTS system n=1 Tax=Paenibacillus pini JCM 16418 TaxID=1236976 RepID=W7YWW5_9BACL|nr:PTS glucose/sucrose transporter subunit IIB [Paenibacillus pini]GAF06869.1 PTS system [Paenibacillus pini JCM 16418]
MEDELPFHILAALGGKENVTAVDACITRLRVDVIDPNKADQEQLKALGAQEVFELGNHIQAIFGMESEVIMTQLANMLQRDIDHDLLN